MDRMWQHAARFETEIINDHIHTVDLQSQPYRLIGDRDEYTCDSLIVSTGASARYLGLESEERYKGKGVPLAQPVTDFFIGTKKSQ